MMPFSKDEYLVWVAKRGQAGNWNIEDCRRADAHIKAVAVSNFMNKIDGLDKELQEYLDLMVSHHYGSAETDALLTKLGCYPDYMQV